MHQISNSQLFRTVPVSVDGYVCHECGPSDKCATDPDRNENCYNSYCETIANETGISRKCGFWHDIYDREIDTDYLYRCVGPDFCNDKKYEKEHCYSTTYDSDNWKPPSEQSRIACAFKTLRKKGCYHLEEYNTVKKGCMTDLNQQNQTKCEQSNDCEICHGKDCNSKVVRHRLCYHCTDASKTNCAEPTEVHDTVNISNFSYSCLVGIDQNGLTHRLWKTNKTHDNNLFPNGFETCDRNSCNNMVYPSGRLKCFQCQGDSDCNDVEQKLNPKVCRIYSSKDQCYTYFAEGKHFRGCWSDQTESQMSCEQNESKCIKCEGDGCNTATQAPTQAPTTQLPTTEVPTTQAPSTELPTTQESTTEVPTTQAPSTELPTTEVPTTQVPTTQATTKPPIKPPSTKPPPIKPSREELKWKFFIFLGMLLLLLSVLLYFILPRRRNYN
ncbi:uncharacterized protein LOC116338248 [Contarinia nasturtii]|uniref:uncharacterized protein LOC116338248 n=1 Tax=Contarinia nasturtii TaxID=265458 RepID=UPI0012D378E5|nr:uncharacterized protein LOC116338248 [Contarinia nasturtii]